VSWSLLTAHMTPAIALQLMRGSYNGQQRPLASKKDTKFHSVCVWIWFSGNTNNLVRKTKSGPGVFLEFWRVCEKGARWEQGGKSNTNHIIANHNTFPDEDPLHFPHSIN